MEVEIKEYKGSKTIHRATDFDGGYDPINGFYLSSQMFDGDFESDLSRLNLSTLVCNSHYLKHLDDRNTDDIFRIVSLKSLDGTNEMQSCPPKEESLICFHTHRPIPLRLPLNHCVIGLNVIKHE